MSKKIMAWHFVANDYKLRYGSNLLVEPGFIYSAEGPLVLCENGMHASIKASDALVYAPGSILCRVALWGEAEESTDKIVARHREVVSMRNISKELRLFACWCVRETKLQDGRKVWDLLTDERSKNAVVVAEQFANGNATKEQLDAARATAWDATRAAARDAAWDAARDAARAAAWDEFNSRMDELFLVKHEVAS